MQARKSTQIVRVPAHSNEESIMSRLCTTNALIAVITGLLVGCTCISPKYVWDQAPTGADITHVVVASPKAELLNEFHQVFSSMDAYKSEQCRKISSSRHPAETNTKDAPAEPLFYSCKGATQATYQQFGDTFARIAPKDPPLTMSALIACSGSGCVPSSCAGVYACFKTKPICWKC